MNKTMTKNHEPTLERLGYNAICMTPEGRNVVFNKRHKTTWIIINIERDKPTGYVDPLYHEISEWSEVNTIIEAFKILERDLEELRNE